MHCFRGLHRIKTPFILHYRKKIIQKRINNGKDNFFLTRQGLLYHLKGLSLPTSSLVDFFPLICLACNAVGCVTRKPGGLRCLRHRLCLALHCQFFGFRTTSIHCPFLQQGKGEKWHVANICPCLTVLLLLLLLLFFCSVNWV